MVSVLSSDWHTHTHTHREKSTDIQSHSRVWTERAGDRERETKGNSHQLSQQALPHPVQALLHPPHLSTGSLHWLQHTQQLLWQHHKVVLHGLKGFPTVFACTM